MAGPRLSTRTRVLASVLVEGSTAKAIGVGTLLALLTLGAVAGTAVVGFVVVGNAMDLWPDRIDTAPLDEVVDGLEVLEPPTNHCPESADSCWASVVVSSGGDRTLTARAIAGNSGRAGFFEVEGFNGRWTAQRGDQCLSIYEPEELQVHDAAQFPADALYIGLNPC